MHPYGCSHTHTPSHTHANTHTHTHTHKHTHLTSHQILTHTPRVPLQSWPPVPSTPNSCQFGHQILNGEMARGRNHASDDGDGGGGGLGVSVRRRVTHTHRAPYRQRNVLTHPARSLRLPHKYSYTNTSTFHRGSPADVNAPQKGLRQFLFSRWRPSLALRCDGCITHYTIWNECARSDENNDGV
jgi:hypothetical protein